MEKVKKKIKELKDKFKFSKVKQVLKDPKVISYLKILQERYVICPIDKAANNIAFTCKKYVQVLLKELGLLLLLLLLLSLLLLLLLLLLLSLLLS